MDFKNFRLHSILHDLLLAATIILFLFLLFYGTHRALLIIPIAVAVFLTVGHIRFIEKTNRDLTRFFENIRYSDFSLTFSRDKRGKSFDELKSRMNEVLDRFREARTAEEEQFHFLQTVVQHVGIALVAFRSDGEIILINTPAIRLFKAAQVSSIDMLKTFSEPLVEVMKRLQFGERELVRVQNDNDVLQLAVYATEFILKDKKVTLVSIQDIRSELEEKEMEAWQKLIRVLTHEIMNSISPIVSYASSINDLLERRRSGEGDTAELLDDIHSAIQAIEGRGQGLIHFVNNYRNLTAIPKPSFRICPVRELLDTVITLMRSELDSKNILCSVVIDPDSLSITVDMKLIEQVMINLMINAIQAVSDCSAPAVSIEAGLEKRGRVFIKVTDNGCGIEEAVLDKIFIPFFTTKKSGSGIGLSLSRQIMRLHGGSISVSSKINTFTEVILHF